MLCPMWLVAAPNMDTINTHFKDHLHIQEKEKPRQQKTPPSFPLENKSD